MMKKVTTNRGAIKKQIVTFSSDVSRSSYNQLNTWSLKTKT